MVRLEPMTEEEFRQALERAVPRHAERRIRRGEWAAEEATAASRGEYAQLFPQGRATPGYHFCHIVDEASGARVGEAWYQIDRKVGKMFAWIDWIWVEPEHRRRGFAQATFRLIEAEATRAGADRIGLFVHDDNPGARALYDRLGYAPTSHRMEKPLVPTDAR